jgi:hypothetical protein
MLVIVTAPLQRNWRTPARIEVGHNLDTKMRVIW